MHARDCRSARVMVALTLAALLGFTLPAPAAGAAMGHYLSFDRTRNLQTDMVDLLERPETATKYHLGLAQRLDAALRTPGMRGIWMEFDWRSVEVGDGQYDWSLIDTNMAVARKYGLDFIIEVADRSFNGAPIMPEYFPPEYVLETSGGGNSGYTSKRWDPYVYNRLIRLYKAIARRYANHEAFGGIATSESATGTFSGGDYSVAKYRNALVEIVTQTQAALVRGKLFFYLNFINGGNSSDMNKDVRVSLLRDVPHDKLVVGAPDVTPDVPGMPRSVTAYRLHVRKTMPELSQLCHFQHVDQGLGAVNVKNNTHRIAYFEEVAAARERERQSWFKGEPAVFEFDDLRDPQGNKVDLHPESVLGQYWRADELFRYGRRNFDCKYYMWHYREFARPNEFQWPEVRAVIENHQCFYLPNGCASAERAAMPNPPNLR